MHDVKVIITDKDRNVGAMVKALAVEVSGFKAVSGTTKEYLNRNGHYVFHFPYAGDAEKFRLAISKYISTNLAQVVD
jgi:hypothetical protein